MEPSTKELLDRIKQLEAQQVAAPPKDFEAGFKLIPQPELQRRYQTNRAENMHRWLPESVFRGASRSQEGESLRTVVREELEAMAGSGGGKRK
jgi:hypothetical protein